MLVGQEITNLKGGTFKHIELKKYEYRMSLLIKRMPSDDIPWEKLCH